MDSITDFKNILILPDGSLGEIKTVSTFYVYDCYEKDWSQKPPVVFRNTLLNAYYPKKIFAIGEISKDETNASMLNPFKPQGSIHPFFLDLASGARNHGRFTFTKEKTIGKLYFGEKPEEQWKRIIYGSIVHTGCKKLVYKQMKYIVVDDTATTYTGNPLDDKKNGIHWKTGDSHGKASSELMALLEVSTRKPDEIDDPDWPVPDPVIEIPIQFRAALRVASDRGWIAKGTVSYNPKCDEMGVDLVIPWSCLKGNKPPLGNYEGKILIGTVFEAEERFAKLGWMIWQWFAFETLDEDNIIERLKAKCDRLSKAFDSIKNLAEVLRVDQNEEEKNLEEGGVPISTD